MKRWLKEKKVIVKSPDRGSLFFLKEDDTRKINSRVIKNIYVFLNNSIEQKYNTDKNGLINLSYYQWALSELILYLEKENKIPILISLEIFKDKMEGFAKLNHKNSFIFLIAYDITREAIDWLVN